MAKNVVVVESPSKVGSVNKYLGPDFTVLSSYGHIRDLPSKNGSVNPDDNFSMVWEFGARGSKSLLDIDRALKKADTLYLATDPDREGEAISWHVVDALKARGSLEGKKVVRIVFNEITKSAVQKAVQSPRAIDQSLVDAYLARRALDYLVGFTLSPVLWRKLPGARSAGRVQSVALRLIVEREAEIEMFNPQEYWSITGKFLNPENKKYDGKLTHLNGKKVSKFDINNETLAKDAVSILEKQTYSIGMVEKKQTKRHPTAPFTTSTLQQEAARKLGFSSKKTMQLAQKLYEGVTIKGETVGLITYMRTDSINLSQDALQNIRGYIEKKYDAKYLPKDVRQYKSKVKNAQEAHEAVRPTDVNRIEKDLLSLLDADHLKLYMLIWKRSVACQMESAIFDQVSIDTVSQDKAHIFRSTGSTLVFDGFLSVYQEGTDDADEEEEDRLPILSQGEASALNNVLPQQHFTQPPPRYSEASLVKRLTELGIGRPSTYVSIIQVLQDRNYVNLEKKQFRPDDRGRIVISFLKHHFSDYVEYDFTANLEEELDDISNGTLAWLNVMKKFWGGFQKATTEAMDLSTTMVIDEVEKDLEHYLFADPTKEGRKCPSCGKGQVNLKLSRYGAFLGCSTYPECAYTKRLVQGEEGADLDPNVVESKFMGDDPNTAQTIHLKKGPYGFYLEWSIDPNEINPKSKAKPKPKRVSIPSMYTLDQVDLALALKLKDLPLKLGEHEIYGQLKIGAGRFGPYVQYADGFASIPKAENFLEVSYDRAVDIVAAKIAKGPSKRSLAMAAVKEAKAKAAAELKAKKKEKAKPKEVKAKAVKKA